jgi:drug/metabolite transporter (DMT)-like permease
MVGALFSFSAVAIAGREAMREIGPLEVVFWRAAYGVLVMALVFACYGGARTALQTRRPGLHAARSAIHLGAQFAWMAAIALIPLVEVFALEFTTPLWVALLSPLFLGERITTARLLAGLLGFAGVLIVIRPESSGLAAATFAIPISLSAGSLFALASALGFAFNIMATRALARTDPPSGLLAWMTGLQLPIASALLLAGPGIETRSIATAGWCLLCALSSLAAHYCLTRAAQLADAIVVAPMDFLRLPLIALVGVSVYDEALRAPVIAGAVCILAANALNLWAEGRHRAQRGRA